MKNLLILGSGISGLSCGVRLLEAGFTNVRIVAKAFPPNTTSDVAGGLWFPYKAEPKERITAWSRTTFAEMLRLQSVPEAGITMTRFFQLCDYAPEGEAWWSSSVDVYRKLTMDKIAEEFPTAKANGIRGGFYAEVPIAEPQKHLPFLMERFGSLGGIAEQGEVHDLSDIGDIAGADAETIVVNCTGLDAKALVGDEHVFPIRGQIVRVKNNGIARSITLETQNHDTSEHATYTIARSEDVILGGIAMMNDWTTSIDSSLADGILARCAVFEPRLADAEILQHKVGLRPGRTTVRLEAEHIPSRDGSVRTIIHNYGHGGSGYTVNWGCADDVVALIRRVQG
jgi:D-amino-acid oxidase